MPQPHTMFQLSYLQEQLRLVSSKNPVPTPGKFLSNFNHSPEQQALFVLLLAERIKEMEAAERVKPKEIEY